MPLPPVRKNRLPIYILSGTVALLAVIVFMLGSLLLDAVYPSLCRAAQSGDTQRIEYLISRGEFPDRRILIHFDSRMKYATALALAARSGQIRACEVLLKAGADPEATDKMGRTILMIAVEGDQVEICKLLLKHGSDPTRASRYPVTPLQFAIDNHKWDIVDVLKPGTKHE